MSDGYKLGGGTVHNKTDYRRTLSFRYYLKEKYSKLLELDLIKRSAARICNFARRYVIYNVKNLKNEDIKEIPSQYRYRIKILNEETSDMVESVYKESLIKLRNITDDDIISTVLYDIQRERENMLKTFYNMESYYVPLMIDLRIYGQTPNIKILYNNQFYTIPKDEQNKIKEMYNKVNEDTPRGIRFKQMLDTSRTLCKAYNKQNTFSIKE